jgi:hypothetical protein
MKRKLTKDISIRDVEREVREGFTLLSTLVQALNKDLRDHVLTVRQELQELIDLSSRPENPSRRKRRLT